MTTFVKNPGDCSPLPEIRRTPEQEKSLMATKEFMRNFSKKIILFLSLKEGGNIHPGDEVSQRDLEEIEVFFSQHPEVHITFDSEVLKQRLEINIDTISILKPYVLLRIFGKFLDMFEDFPSKYSLHGLISSAVAYETSEGISIISQDTILEKRKLLLESEIRGQEDAIGRGIYTDEETMKKKYSRLQILQQKLKDLSL